MAKIKKEDDVLVIAGRDKGKRGEVMRVLNDGRLLVSGSNVVKKHQRPNPNMNEQGGILDQEAPIDASNVAIFNEATKKLSLLNNQREYYSVFTRSTYKIWIVPTLFMYIK